MASARAVTAGSAVARHTGLRASGATDPGIQREVNEDRYSCDAERGVFIVIDGVGGQAAGGRAADEALARLRERLHGSDQPPADSLRHAIARANNEVRGLAASRPEWAGMACVLTAVVVRHGIATFGHVGDTRLYKLRRDTIEKLTRDHSPVGEREDANEISERQAMLHPRRNEVYRDVGSDYHDAYDRDFIDIGEVPFEPDAALLLCSDGLTDLVDATFIARTAAQHAGDPEAVVAALIAGANTAGGKDNVTAVYVEGAEFAASGYGRSGIDVRSFSRRRAPAEGPRSLREAAHRRTAMARLSRVLLLVLLAGVAAAAVAWYAGWRVDDLLSLRVPVGLEVRPEVTVAPGASINDAIRGAEPGSDIWVEPGEYREQVTLRSGIRLISRVAREAVIRLPAAVPPSTNVPAVIARNVTGADLVGFRVSGDSATPLPVGVLVENSTVNIVDVEITGATIAAVEFAGTGAPSLMASDIRDNAGAAVVVRDGASPRISHNAFARNRGPGPLPSFAVARGASATFAGNVFFDVSPAAFTTIDPGVLRRDNLFADSVAAPSSPSNR